MRYFIAISLLAALTAGSGCSSAPERQYFGISYTLAKEDALSKPRFPVTLRIKEPGIVLAYDRPQIVYRYDPYRFKYYNYKFWVAKPQQMLAEIVHRHLKHANLFDEVSLSFQRQVPQYELEGEIAAIEEYDSGDKWYAHLALSFRLVRFEDRQVIWTFGFDETREVFNKEPVYVVRAMSELVDEQMVLFLEGIEKAMAQESLPGTGGSMP